MGYVKHLSCYHSETKNTEVVNGTSYTLLVPTPTRTLRPVTYVWANATDGISSFIKIYSVQVNQQIALKDLGTTVLSSCCARSIVYVPGTSGGVAQSNSDNPLRTDLVWIATDDRRILLYASSDPEKGFEVGRIVLPVDPSCQIYHCGKVFVGLVNGSVSVFRRDHTVNWDLKNPQIVVLGSDPITCILPVSGALYASTGRKIIMLDAWTNSVVRSFTANKEESPNSTFQGSVASLLTLGGTPGCVSHMAVCGVGLWVSMASSSTIALYHTESVFGLYGDLMNVEEYECESTNNLEGSTKDIHKSDPELDTIPYRIGTLDRRVAMKSNRPRSLDLSSWSVDSKDSSTHTTSGSESGSQKQSPSLSRTASSASDSNTSESSCTTSRTESTKLSQTLTQDSNAKTLKSKHDTVQRTVTTLMGGRGYIQWRATHLERNKTSHLAQINNSDAYLVIWDHKL